MRETMEIQQRKEGRHGGRRRLIWCLLLVCLAAIWFLSWQQLRQRPAEQQLDVWFFACSEDGDSVLLHSGDTDVMIDTGLAEDSEALVQKLRKLGVEQIDLLVLTHPDKDHIGGAVALLDAFEIGQVMETDCVKGSELQKQLEQRLGMRSETKMQDGEDTPSETKEQGVEGTLPEVKVLRPGEKQQLALGNLQLVIYPPMQQSYQSANNYSIGVLAEYEGIRFFFAGDAKKKRIEELLAEQLPRVQVYKAAYHGRDTGGSRALLTTLQPEWVVVTAGEPEPETAETIREMGADCLSTYEKDVHFTVKAGILDVE